MKKSEKLRRERIMMQTRAHALKLLAMCGYVKRGKITQAMRIARGLTKERA